MAPLRANNSGPKEKTPGEAGDVEEEAAEDPGEFGAGLPEEDDDEAGFLFIF